MCDLGNGEPKQESLKLVDPNKISITPRLDKVPTHQPAAPELSYEILIPRSGVAKNFNFDPQTVKLNEIISDKDANQWKVVQVMKEPDDTLILETLNSPKQVLKLNKFRDFRLTNRPKFLNFNIEVLLANGKKHQVLLQIPEVQANHFKEFEDHIKKSFGSITEGTIRATKTVVLFSSYHLKDFGLLSDVSRAGGMAQGQAFWQNMQLSREDLSIFLHEHAHNVAFWFNQNFEPPQGWAKVVKSEKHVVSEYAKTNLKEDWAESVMWYLKTKGGQLDPDTRAKMPERVRFLDEFFARMENFKHDEADLWVRWPRMSFRFGVSFAAVYSGLEVLSFFLVDSDSEEDSAETK